jgi:hypothetical protein
VLPKDPTKVADWKRRVGAAAKLRKPNLGRKFGPEVRKKMSEAHNGLPKSAATIEKLRNHMLSLGPKNPFWKGGVTHIPGQRAWMKHRRDVIKRTLNKNGSFHTHGEWELLKAQYNWTCPACRRQEPDIKLTEDHVVPLSKGGGDNIENIQPLCGSCNCKKHDKIITY